jgi:hypothetical protein
MELERIRALAVEDMDSSDFRMHTQSYAAPQFIAPKLEPFPELVFRRDEHMRQPEQIPDPTLPGEPQSVLKVVRKLQSPRRKPVAWRKWAVRGGIAAAVLITAATAVVMESRTPVSADIINAAARAGRSIQAAATTRATPAAPAVTDSSAGRLGTATPDSTPAPTEVARAATPDSATAIAPAAVVDSARLKARRDSLRRAASLAPSDSVARAPAASRVRRPTRVDPQDLMDLSDSLSSGKVESSPEPPALPQPNGP